MTKGREKAIASLAESLRKHLPNDAGLSDDDIVKKYIAEEQLGHLASYYDTLMSAAGRMETAIGS
jgi:hypothetical protein